MKTIKILAIVAAAAIFLAPATAMAKTSFNFSLNIHECIAPFLAPPPPPPPAFVVTPMPPAYYYVPAPRTIVKQYHYYHQCPVTEVEEIHHYYPYPCPR